MAKNEVAVADQKFNLVTLTEELKEAIAEEMDGLGTIPVSYTHLTLPTILRV